MRILVATDGSPCSDAAVEAVARRPWPEGTEVQLISVVEVPMSFTTETWALPVDYYGEVEKTLIGRANSAIASAARTIGENPTKGLAITSGVFKGSPKHAILDEAASWHADLIVVGSHGYGLVERFLIGSVSLAVASHAKCSVEIVRCREAKTEKGS